MGSEDSRRDHVWTGCAGASRLRGGLVLILEGTSLSECTVLHLGLRPAGVVASVTVRGWAGFLVIPAKILGVPWAGVEGVGGGGRIMAAG